MKIMTLCLLRKHDKLLLGMKKQGFGSGKYNGFGGKVEMGETVEEAAKREVVEEVGITVHSFSKTAELNFHFPHKPEWNCLVHVFLTEDWTGEPVESNEMRPEWFAINSLPYAQQWADDAYWIPPVLEGKFVNGTF